ncbi:MAG TPA: outer membrane beta-barrel protein [Thermoanaerobaculia bacterium]|nr:outer membrane beta-barrel protein [Thermoanaerobaculia bacterium]
MVRSTRRNGRERFGARVPTRAWLWWLALMALVAAVGAGAQTGPAGKGEKEVSPGSIDAGWALPSFGADPNRRLIINGFGVLGYAYDLNTDQNSFADSAVALSLYKGINDHLTVFAQLTTSRPDQSPFLADQATARSVSTDIDNLQLRWTPSLTAGLDLTLGKFDSPLAIERDDVPLNFQATQSFNFRFARPVKFTGLQLHEAFSPHFELWAIAANGWDQDVDNNKGKTGALYGLWSPSLAAHLGLGVVYGPEKDNRAGDSRTATVATLLLQPFDNWVWGGEGIAGSEPHSSTDVPGGTARWYSGMLFTHYRYGHNWAVTLRLDYFDDQGGALSGVTQTLRSLTLSPQYLIGGGFYGIFRYLERTTLRLPETAIRLDLRYDHSTAPVFASRQGGVGKRNHGSATLQTVFLF